jgi:hypothetical protein
LGVWKTPQTHGNESKIRKKNQPLNSYPSVLPERVMQKKKNIYSRLTRNEKEKYFSKML